MYALYMYICIVIIVVIYMYCLISAEVEVIKRRSHSQPTTVDGIDHTTHETAPEDTASTDVKRLETKVHYKTIILYMYIYTWLLLSIVRKIFEHS